MAHPARVRALALAAGSIALVGRLHAQNFDTVQVKATPVAGAVHMLTGSGGNIGLVVGDDAVFLVDDQFAPLTPKILAAKANVMHTGDVFVSDRFSFVDRSSGGTIHGIIAATERLVATTNAQTKIIPGHGPLADRARLQAYHDMLVVLRDRMRKEIAARHTVEQVLASSITKEYDAQWPNGRERFLRILYQELSAAK